MKAHADKLRAACARLRAAGEAYVRATEQLRFAERRLEPKEKRSGQVVPFAPVDNN